MLRILHGTAYDFIGKWKITTAVTSRSSCPASS